MSEETKEFQHPLIHVMNAENGLINIHKDFRTAPTVSVEGIGDIVEGITNMLTKRFNYIISFFSSGSKKNFSAEVSENLSEYHKQLKLKEYLFENMIRNLPVETVLNTKVVKPLGLKVDYLVASKLLKEGLEVLDKELFPALDKLDTYVSSIVTDEAVRLSSRPLVADKSLRKINDVIGGILNKLVKPNGTDEIVAVRELLPAVNKVRDIYKNLEECSTINNLTNLTHIEKIIDSIRSKCEELVSISNNNPGFRIKKPILMNLANQLEEGALAVTNASALITIYIQVVNYFITMGEQLNGITK